MISRKKFHQ